MLDLHAVPGWQNPGWHCDNPYGVSLFWRETFYQDQVIALWRFLADRYKDEPAIAGYDLLNEPYAPSNEVVVSFFERLIPAIREVDPRHL
ncbi:cellulase family glycosylhydrolase, partial [Acinetobacter baumannii]